MKKQPSGGRSFVRAVRLLWLGFTAGSFAAHVATSPDAVKASVQVYDEHDLLVEEIMYEEIPKLEKRLAFEAWADEREV